MKWGIGVPGFIEAVTVRMYEGEDGWEGMVMIYYIREVCHCLMALVLWCCEGVIGGGIDGVDCVLPTGQGQSATALCTI